MNARKTIYGVTICAMTLMLAGCASTREKLAIEKYSEVLAATYADVVSTADPPGENSTFDDYANLAFRRNPGLKAAFQRWKAALERIPQARALDDPELTYERSLDEVDFVQRLAVSQAIPGFGKLGLRERKAVAEAEAAMHEFEAMKLDAFFKIVQTFHEYWYLGRATAVTDENVRLLEDIEKVVRVGYEAGSAQFSELIKIQVETDRMKNELASLRDERRAGSAALAAVLNLPNADVLPWPAIKPSAQAMLSEDVLRAMLKDLNPELKAGEAMIEREKYSEDLARKSRFPDFMLGAGTMFLSDMNGSEGETETAVMGGITIPLWQRKYSAEIREASAMREAAALDRDELENNLIAELRMAIFKTRDAERRIGLLRDSLIPKATQAFEVARKDFSGGKTDFMTLIDAQRTLLEFRLMLERAIADREIALGEIGWCIGKYGAPAETAAP